MPSTREYQTEDKGAEAGVNSPADRANVADVSSSADRQENPSADVVDSTSDSLEGLSAEKREQLARIYEDELGNPDLVGALRRDALFQKKWFELQRDFTTAEQVMSMYRRFSGSWILPDKSTAPKEDMPWIQLVPPMVRARHMVGKKIEEVRKRLGADYQQGAPASQEIQDLRALERNATLIWDLPETFRSLSLGIWLKTNAKRAICAFDLHACCRRGDACKHRHLDEQQYNHMVEIANAYKNNQPITKPWPLHFPANEKPNRLGQDVRAAYRQNAPPQSTPSWSGKSSWNWQSNWQSNWSQSSWSSNSWQQQSRGQQRPRQPDTSQSDRPAKGARKGEGQIYF